MNSDWLLKHFEQISEAPDAVARLRRFILDLAVRGKLVEQDPADEPASDLLKKIEAEKERLVKEGEIKKPEVFQTVADDELPFSIPSGWCAMRMGWLARKLGAGSTPLGGKSVYQDEGIPFLRSQNIHDDGLQLEDVALITRTVHDRMSGTHIQDQDILLNITGASIGRCALVPSSLGEGNVSQHVAIIRLFVPAIREFIHLSLISPSYQKLIRDVQVGVSREGLSMQRLRLFPMLIPPLAEQHRIAAKVDELMALCDELEGTQAKRERQRDRLVAATLRGLNNGNGSSEPGVHPTFEESARFYFNHLTRLTTRPEHIHQLRQTILNLAVRGKLVSRIASEGTAEPLIEEINATREALFAEGKVGRHSPVGPVREDEMPFAIPPVWRWMCFGDITFCRDGERIPVSREERQRRQGPFDYYGASGVIDKIDGFLFDKPLLLIGEDGANLINRSTPIAFIARGRFWVNNHAHVLDGISEGFLRYIELFINATDLKPYITGTAQPKMNQAKMNSIPVALPPLAEQNRIVAKVDELMALCDDLETRITTTVTTRHQLLEASLQGALKGGS